jgi:hypothetical protein
MSRKFGALTYRMPKGLLRPVAGKLYDENNQYGSESLQCWKKNWLGVQHN